MSCFKPVRFMVFVPSVMIILSRFTLYMEPFSATVKRSWVGVAETLKLADDTETGFVSAYDIVLVRFAPLEFPHMPLMPPGSTVTLRGGDMAVKLPRSVAFSDMVSVSLPWDVEFAVMAPDQFPSSTLVALCDSMVSLTDTVNMSDVTLYMADCTSSAT